MTTSYCIIMNWKGQNFEIGLNSFNPPFKIHSHMHIFAICRTKYLISLVLKRENYSQFVIFQIINKLCTKNMHFLSNYMFLPFTIASPKRASKVEWKSWTCFECYSSKLFQLILALKTSSYLIFSI